MKSKKHQLTSNIIHLIRQKIRSSGGMFFFLYDAKYKETLPLWDRFPLVIPFRVEADSFIGLNLHYLPIPDRVKLLNFLVQHKRKKTIRHYMAISYSVLSAAAHTTLFKPCIHRYLKSHVKTRLVKVDHEEWENVAKLPVQQFQKRKAILGEKHVRSKKRFRISRKLSYWICQTKSLSSLIYLTPWRQCESVVG